MAKHKKVQKNISLIELLRETKLQTHDYIEIKREFAWNNKQRKAGGFIMRFKNVHCYHPSWLCEGIKSIHHVEFMKIEFLNDFDDLRSFFLFFYFISMVKH